MAESYMVGEKKISSIVGRIVSYIVFVSWTVITLFPLIWMTYSSFKSNEELTRNMFNLPHDLFDNNNDVYIVIEEAINVINQRDYDAKKDPRERMIIESTTIAPQRRHLVFFLVKEDMPPEIQKLQIGDTLEVNQLPPRIRAKIGWRTVWHNFVKSWETGKLGLGFLNSTIYAVCSTFFIILFGLMISFAISKLKFKFLSKIVLAVIGLGYLISLQAVIIPLFLMLRSIRLVDTHLGIIIVYVAFGLPIAVLLASQFMNGLPDSLIESAHMDGATPMRAFLSIMVPMCVPVIITISIISALGIWNEFMLVLVISSSDKTKSLPVGVFSFSSLTGTQFGWQLAALVLATVPILVVYTIFQKQLAEGVVGGAIKE
ncbi:MAG: carbohydrate ABC transporter permease [Spirochaetales bacterium]|nr:carbohydrate ABC transporter permease [Spirochaetales bacterium]